MDVLGKWMIHILGGMEGDGARVDQAAQNGTRYKTYKWFISVNFHLTFLDYC